jgi:hypothetical protein
MGGHPGRLPPFTPTQVEGNRVPPEMVETALLSY